MTKLRCCFCQQELLLSSFRDGDEEHQMWNCLSCQLSAQRKLWQELIRTRKALDVAVDGLECIGEKEYIGENQTPTGKFARIILNDIKQITETRE